MIGKIFITSSGYDPQFGKHIKDPYLGSDPSLGACRPDFRRQLEHGDHVFVVSGKVPNVQQVLLGGFEVAEKITAQEAYERFPEQRLQLRADGQVTGNVIVDGNGAQHALDQHPRRKFVERTKNYLVGTNVVALTAPDELSRGREQTLDVLREICRKNGDSVFQIIGHFGKSLTEEQVAHLRKWLLSLKKPANDHF